MPKHTGRWHRVTAVLADRQHRVWVWLTRPMLWAALLVALAVYLIRDKSLVLEYLKVLTWPVVAGAIFYSLREPIRAKLAGLHQFTAGPVSGSFLTGLALQESVSDLASPTLEPATHGDGAVDMTIDGDEAEDGAGDAVGEPTPRAAALTQEFRDGLSIIVQKAIEHGFAAAQSPNPALPFAYIDWSNDGSPQLVLAGYSGPGPTAQEIRMKHHLTVLAARVDRLRKVISARSEQNLLIALHSLANELRNGREFDMLPGSPKAAGEMRASQVHDSAHNYVATHALPLSSPAREEWWAGLDEAVSDAV